MGYLRRVYLLPADLEEPFVADLWLAGTLGVQSLAAADGRVRLEAWFAGGALPDDGLDDRPDDRLADLGAWGSRGVEPAGEEAVPEADWLAAYRERARPFPVGRTLFLDPREPDPAVPAAADPIEIPSGRRLLRLPARAAFGTGSHESTSLALELLEGMDLAGRRVLDVGTGTGVLAFAALLGGARLAVAFDDDPAAPFHARENAALNRLAPRLFAGRLAAVRAPGSDRPGFDLALVNVVPEQILPELPGVVGRLAPAGEVIFSGILRERGLQVLGRLSGLGLALRERREAGDWVAFRLVRSGSAAGRARG